MNVPNIQPRYANTVFKVIVEASAYSTSCANRENFPVLRISGISLTSSHLICLFKLEKTYRTNIEFCYPIIVYVTCPPKNLMHLKVGLLGVTGSQMCDIRSWVYGNGLVHLLAQHSAEYGDGLTEERMKRECSLWVWAEPSNRFVAQTE